MRRELPLLGVIILVSLALITDHSLDRIDGVILLGTLAFLLTWIVKLALQSRVNDPMLADYTAEIRSDLSLPAAISWLLVGLVVLLASSRMLVWGAVNIATTLGVSDLIIGLTIVALGTSLPELAASIIAAYKKEYDIAIGNILGSNLFNILAVLGLPGLIHPSAVEPEVLTRDYPVMIGLTLLLFMFAYGFRRGPGRISRKGGALLLTIYVSNRLHLSSSSGT